MNNLSAFLRVIRDGESSQGGMAYRTLVYGSTFDSFADHPRIHFDLTTKQRVDDWHSAPPNSTTSAAGAFQIVETTWNAFTAARGPHDFSPASQDECAAWLIERRHATSDIIDGDLRRAIAKCKDEWQAFETMTYEHAEAVFTRYGGTLAGETPAQQPAAEPAPATTGAPAMGALLFPLIQTLIGAFAPAAKAQIEPILEKSGGNPAAADSIVSAALGIIANLTGTKQETLVADPKAAITAVSTVMADPVKLQSAEDTMVSHFAALAPMLDKMAAYDQAVWAAQNLGRQTVSSIAIEEHKAGLWDMTEVIVKTLLGMLGVIAGGLLAGIVWLAISGKADANPAMLTALVGLAGPIWTGAIVASVVAIVAYRFDGTKDSTAAVAAQGAVNMELAKK